MNRLSYSYRDVVLCTSLDICSAVEGINIDGSEHYLSSTTWTLLGLKFGNALTDERGGESDFTYERRRIFPLLEKHHGYGAGEHAQKRTSPNRLI